MSTAIELFEHQKIAVELLRSGSILCGGVGSGKSITALSYFFVKECGGSIDPFLPMANPMNLYIITTAMKRDSCDWLRECARFCLSDKEDCSFPGCIVTIDSWNNIGKYVDVKNSFFIFDEQRVVGSGAWVKSFYKIVKRNRWILLSATPGDTWMDYIPVFVANGFYKNKTDFIRRHVVYSHYSRFPKVDHYVEQGRLLRLKNQITVNMTFSRKTTSHFSFLISEYNRSIFRDASKNRWNFFEDRPIRDVNELCYVMRKISNSDPSRLSLVLSVYEKHGRAIVFYNFNYELEALRDMCQAGEIVYAEWNGHKHEEIPQTEKWLYLVQYQAGSEGWECITTNTVIFYSLNYSYKIMHQASGRIDRLNTPYQDLYYYLIRSSAPIDVSILRALKEKRSFNEKKFVSEQKIDV